MSEGMQSGNCGILYFQALINAVEGNLDEGLIFCGLRTGEIREISTVRPGSGGIAGMLSDLFSEKIRQKRKRNVIL